MTSGLETNKQTNTKCMVSRLETVETMSSLAMGSKDEPFEIIDEKELEECSDKETDSRMSEISDITDSLYELSELSPDAEEELHELVEELRHLEERLHLWTEVRTNTILRL